MRLQRLDLDGYRSFTRIDQAGPAHSQRSALDWRHMSPATSPDTQAAFAYGAQGSSGCANPAIT
jgi:hypothetical protein